MASDKEASPGQTSIAGSQKNFMTSLQNDFGTAFAGSQNIINGLTKAMQTSLAAGPSQFGFSAPETTALNTLATTANATAYRNARAAAGASAAAAGGSSYLPSGGQNQIQADLAAKFAENQSNQLLGIQEAGYKQGNENFNNAAKNLEETASLENPTGLASAANQAGNDAFGSATTLFKQKQAASPWSQLGGLAGSLAGAGLNMLVPGAGSLLSAGVGSITKGQQSADVSQGYSNAQDMDSGGGSDQIYANTINTLPH